MSLSDLSKDLRLVADKLDTYAAATAAPSEAQVEAIRSAETALDAVAATERPDGVTPGGWEGFVRGDNPDSLPDADRALLVAAGLIATPVAESSPAGDAAPPDVLPVPDPTQAPSGEVVPVPPSTPPSGEGGGQAGVSGGDATAAATPPPDAPPVV